MVYLVNNVLKRITACAVSKFSLQIKDLNDSDSFVRFVRKNDFTS